MEEDGLMLDERSKVAALPSVGLALARRLEAADVSANIEYARAHAALRPEERAAWMEIGGGCVIYAGVESPLTQAVGVGLDGAISGEEFEALEDFFLSRGARPAVEVCPLADASLHELLRARIYHPDEPTDKLFLHLSEDDDSARLSPPPELRVGRVAPEEAEVWARTVAAGFFEGAGEPPRPYLDIFRIKSRMRTGVCFLAELGGQAAGGGFLHLDAGKAALSSASVLPHARRRGVQTALVRARLAYALEQGCDLAAMTARPGTTSHRNAVRLGFRVAYSRAKMSRER
jgi:GNAT superfamily N-acetyltransferase